MSNPKHWAPNMPFGLGDVVLPAGVVVMDFAEVIVSCPCGVGSARWPHNQNGRAAVAVAADAQNTRCNGCGRVFTMLNGVPKFVMKDGPKP
jgi:hypothetical protein